MKPYRLTGKMPLIGGMHCPCCVRYPVRHGSTRSLAKNKQAMNRAARRTYDVRKEEV